MDLHLNPILDSDGYKPSHWLQYPPKTDASFSYMASRGGEYSSTQFAGLQPILKRFFSRKITHTNVEEAKSFMSQYGVPFNEAGFRRIVDKHGGYWPLLIRAVPEGTVIPTRNVLATFESTDPELFWVPSYVETVLMRVWYPTTVATRSWHARQVIMEALRRSCEDPYAFIGSRLHDFGSRGVSSSESALYGGIAHMINFSGSDTMIAVAGVMDFYGLKDRVMPAWTIPAAEHFTITAWGREREADAYLNMLDQFAKPGAILAVVSDSYDISNAITEIWGRQLRQRVIDSGALVVIRPDSGEPSTMVVRCLQELEKAFGSTRNKKGYKVLNNVAVIHGDGISDVDVIRGIYSSVMETGFSAQNVALGMGGGLLQKLDRDTQEFAIKGSAVRVDGAWRSIKKSPKHSTMKASMGGRLDLVFEQNEFKTVERGAAPVMGTRLVDVYRNGEILKTYTFDEVRATARKFDQ